MRPAAIVAAVCAVLGIERSELLGHSRHRKVVLGRMLVARVCRELTTMSFPEIARVLGRRNHSTVHCAHQRICKLLERHARVEDAIDGASVGGTMAIDEIIEQVRRTARRSG
ncbi:MAG: helix-turn-helix domain-containing protein [Phycisphaerales bacterium]